MVERYNTGNPRPSNSMKDLSDNAQAYDDFMNSENDTFIDRLENEKDTLAGAQKKMAAAAEASVQDARQNLIPLSRQYMTLAAAQADIANIPAGSTTYYRSPDDSALAIEVMNVSGTLQPTGRTMDAGGNIRQEPLSNNLVEFSDPLGFSHSRIRADGGFETPMSLLGENEISSGNLTITVDPNFSDELVMLSDGLGFTVPVTGSDNGGSVDPGEVTVDLPPQTAAYGLLSKMRAALEDVCIIINSDSTGITQDTDPSTGQVFKKWTRKLAEFLAGNYPAYTVNYYSWSSNAYATPETIQIGTAGKTLHFYNAAVAGTQPLYLMGQYFETAYVPRQADLIIFNHGHNTDNNVPASTHMGMDLAILYTMLQRHPNAGAIIVSQNPLRDSDNGTVRSNGARQAAITAGFSLVDVFQLFQNAGKPSAWYMDNIHPNATGDAKIFDLVKNLFVWPASPSRFIPGLAAGTNLLTNAGFSTWTDGLDAPDGWSLTGCTAEKDTTNFESGAYGLRLNQTGTIETYAATSLPAAFVKRLRGKTVVLAARVFVPSTSTRGNCGSIQIPEITNNRPYGTPSGGRGGFIWKATVITVPTTATALTVRAVLDTSGGAAGNWCTFDRLTLIAGTIPQDFY
ncbi:SGNH/GDSL hydrolase family protein [Klebsiella variicola]|uniref:SGNH/GDSL hydrolase family protein n=1 Tax=Klebsiella variicola TaxID=244366 RepID=UPI001F5EA8B8|nr:SGNH/GDSL hydrolase family protein [Klebsiella variicola]